MADRIFKTEVTLVGSSDVETIQPVTALFDDDEVLFVQGSKIYRYKYLDLTSFTEPLQTRNFEVKAQNPVSIDQIDYRRTLPFSQFDLNSCESNDNISACKAAHAEIATRTHS